MTTFALIVVIIALTGNLAILYLPFDKMKKAKLSAVVWVGLTVCAVFFNAQEDNIPVILKDKIAQTKNPESRKAMMATFNITEEKLNTQTEMPTPIELGVTLLLISALVFTPILLSVVRDGNDTTAKKVHQAAFSINVVACAFLLSLHYGLELTIVPWYKKISAKHKNTPILT